MARSGWLGVGAWLALTVGGVTAVENRATAADTEVRDFTVLVDGKRAGEYHMTITHQDDGSDVMTGQANVHVSYLVVSYKYNYNGTEVWMNGRLQRLDSNTNDDGKRYTVNAVYADNVLRVKVNGQMRTVRPDVWVTSYWRLPDAKFRNQAVPLLDADTGRDLSGNLQQVGTNSVNVNGQMQNCVHYKVTGSGIQADLWFDAKERLVRQESIEDGHRTVLDLARIRR